MAGALGSFTSDFSGVNQMMNNRAAAERQAAQIRAEREAQIMQRMQAQRALDLQRELGMGNLDLGRADLAQRGGQFDQRMALDTELGRGGLAEQRMGREQQAGQFDRRMGMEEGQFGQRMALETELGRGGLEEQRLSREQGADQFGQRMAFDERKFTQEMKMAADDLAARGLDREQRWKILEAEITARKDLSEVEKATAFELARINNEAAEARMTKSAELEQEAWESRNAATNAAAKQQMLDPEMIAHNVKVDTLKAALQSGDLARIEAATKAFEAKPTPHNRNDPLGLADPRQWRDGGAPMPMNPVQQMQAAPQQASPEPVAPSAPTNLGGGPKYLPTVPAPREVETRYLSLKKWAEGLRKPARGLSAGVDRSGTLANVLEEIAQIERQYPDIALAFGG